MDIAEEIRQIMDRSDATDYRIAKDTGISLSLVQRIRQGKDAHGVTLGLLLDYFGVKLTKPRKNVRK